MIKSRNALCHKCNSPRTVRNGTRTSMDGTIRQMYTCKKCNNHFTDYKPDTDKRYNDSRYYRLRCKNKECNDSRVTKNGFHTTKAKPRLRQRWRCTNCGKAFQHYGKYKRIIYNSPLNLKLMQEMHKMILSKQFTDQEILEKMSKHRKRLNIQTVKRHRKYITAE